MSRRVFHIIDNLDAGGAQEIIYMLSKYMMEYETTVVSLYRKPQHNYFKKIEPFAPIISLSRSKIYIPLILFRLFKVILKNSDAVFNFHLEASCIIGSIIRFFIPFNMIVTIHAHPSQLPKWKNWLYYTLTKRCNFYVAADKDTEGFLNKFNVSPSKIRFIPLGTELFDQPASTNVKNVLEELHIEHGKIILLNIGRMVPPKGQRDLIHVMRILKDRHPSLHAHLIIVGDGPEFDDLKKLVQELDVAQDTSLTGKRLDLNNFYAIADWFLMPCLDESMGMVVYEALANYIPIIAYNSGSIGEVVNDTDLGFLTDKDPMKIAEIISSTPVEEMKSRLRTKDLTRFSAKHLTNAYCHLYNEAVKL